MSILITLLFAYSLEQAAGHASRTAGCAAAADGELSCREAGVDCHLPHRRGGGSTDAEDTGILMGVSSLL